MNAEPMPTPTELEKFQKLLQLEADDETCREVGAMLDDPTSPLSVFVTRVGEKARNLLGYEEEENNVY